MPKTKTEIIGSKLKQSPMVNETIKPREQMKSVRIRSAIEELEGR